MRFYSLLIILFLCLNNLKGMQLSGLDDEERAQALHNSAQLAADPCDENRNNDVLADECDKSSQDIILRDDEEKIVDSITIPKNSLGQIAYFKSMQEFFPDEPVVVTTNDISPAAFKIVKNFLTNDFDLYQEINNLDQQSLIECIQAAHYLNAPQLLDIVCQEWCIRWQTLKDEYDFETLREILLKTFNNDIINDLALKIFNNSSLLQDLLLEILHPTVTLINDIGNSVKINKDGSIIASLSENTLTLFEVATNKSHSKNIEFEDGDSLVSISPGGNFIAIANNDKQKIFDLKKEMRIETIIGRHCIPEFCPDEKFVATIIDDKTYIWNLSNGECISTINQKSRRLKFLKNGNYALINGNTIELWSIYNAEQPVKVITNKWVINHFAISNDENILIVSNNDSGFIGIWDLLNNEKIEMIQLPYVGAIRFYAKCRGNKYLIYGTTEEMFMKDLHDNSSNEIQLFDACNALTFDISSDGKLYTIHDREGIAVFDAKNNSLIFRCSGNFTFVKFRGMRLFCQEHNTLMRFDFKAQLKSDLSGLQLLFLEYCLTQQERQFVEFSSDTINELYDPLPEYIKKTIMFFSKQSPSQKRIFSLYQGVHNLYMMVRFYVQYRLNKGN